MASLKIIQLTDLHIGDEAEMPFGVDVRQNFLDMLQHITNETFDHLVISGDICFRDPDASIYEWVKAQLNELKKPYSIIAGNHDSNTLINQIYYQQQASTLYYTRILNGYKIFFLDSGPGTISQEQLKWFKDELTFNAMNVVFIHHPPLHAGVPYMDSNHGLKNKEEIIRLLNTYTEPIHFFCGHYHLEKTITQNNTHVHITPSLFFQLDERFTDFKIESHRIGYRKIELSGQNLYTSVKYL